MSLLNRSRASLPSKSNLFIERLTVFLFSLWLLVCNFIRIIRVPLTVDESPNRSDLWLTYGDYVHLTKVTANIHILNSILRKASIDLLGNSPFALRLPVFLAHILFLIFGYLLVEKLFRSGFWRVCVFAILNLNPFIFQFWGYSRGYGLALGLMVCSIYYLIRFVEERKAGLVWASMFFAALAVWSNFSLLNFYLSLAGSYFFLFLFAEEKRTFLRRTLPAFVVVSAVLAWLIAEPIRKLRESGELYYGGDKGLFEDTLGSLVRETVFRTFSTDLLVQTILIILTVLTVASIGFWIWKLMRDRMSPDMQKGVVISLLLLIPLISMVAQFHLLNTKYLIDRTAMFLIVLCWLNLCYFLYCASGKFQLAGSVLIAIIATTQLWNFVQHLNLNKSRNWWLDNYNLMVLNRLAPRANEVGRPLKLRTSWIQMPSMDYYIYTRFSKEFEPLTYNREAPNPTDTTFDYIYVTVDESRSLSTIYEVDTNYEETCILFRKK